jgi:hypothetical protein
VGGGTNDIPLTGNIYDNNREDFIIYRGGTSPQWLIQKRAVGTDERKEATIPADPGTPFVGKFIAGSNRSQVVTFKVDSTPLSWHMTDPMDCDHPTGCHKVSWSWGIYGLDIGLVGNFQDDYLDEIAFYHPYDQKFYIIDPRGSGHTITTGPVPMIDEGFLVGDFLGRGHDQIAQYDTDDGIWYILDPSSGDEIEYDPGWGADDGDVPVTGTYLPPATSGSPQCSQLGIWREQDQTLYIADVSSLCGSRTNNVMYWGSKNDFSNVFDPGFPECTYYPSTVPPFLNCKDDIPLTIKDDASLIDRPVWYRPTKGAYPDSIANGQWWVHDKFP